jgi:hypothetical protein
MGVDQGTCTHILNRSDIEMLLGAMANFGIRMTEAVFLNDGRFTANNAVRLTPLPKL